jgi:hypothetical protein
VQITKRAIAIGVASAAAIATGPAVATGAGVATGPGDATTVDAAPAAAKVHHMRFVARPTGGHNTGRGTFVGTEVNRRHGKIVGYDTLSVKFNFQTNKALVRAAISRRGGLLFVRATLGESPRFTGKVTGGRGRFGGARGTVRGFSPEGENKTFVRIRYHF